MSSNEVKEPSQQETWRRVGEGHCDQCNAEGNLWRFGAAKTLVCADCRSDFCMMPMFYRNGEKDGSPCGRPRNDEAHVGVMGRGHDFTPVAPSPESTAPSPSQTTERWCGCGNRLPCSEHHPSPEVKPEQTVETARAVEMIAAERNRQVEREGWTAEHDDKHGGEELAIAAALYATPDWQREYRPHADCPQRWPWAPHWWKPTPDDRIRELVKAGALVVAEVERLQREEAANEVE